MNKEPNRPTIARRNELQGKKTKLETQIRNTADPIAQAKLRADYREITDELENYYADVKEGLQS